VVVFVSPRATTTPVSLKIISGRRNRKYLDHFTSCEGLSRVNSTVHVKRKRDLDWYARFIQPAEDLARLDLEAATNFLCNAYDIKYLEMLITHLPILW